ncbi:hypothetical protein GH714_041082 [Hevea brasiliensis]|uniref:FAE domain-containing protein n=1 Tax=Hevea brasiliensis TaxID=3981 RepID=A0A6A6N008_HEVBR|nr:hypothetical protein GH714_041082 [Hevea brasiliensis]
MPQILPDFSNSVKLKYVKLGYQYLVNHILYLLLIPVMVGISMSAGLISIDLARDLLQVHPNSNAVVVSTEIITPNYYQGNERAMLLPNCLFRMGGAAILLSNPRSQSWRAKYRLVHVVRTTKEQTTKLTAVFEEEDKEGKVGIICQKI